MKLLSFNIGKFVYNIWSREPGAFRLFTLLIIIFCFLLVRGSTNICTSIYIRPIPSLHCTRHSPLAATSVQRRMPESALQKEKKVVVRFVCFCFPWMHITGRSGDKVYWIKIRQGMGMDNQLRLMYACTSPILTGYILCKIPWWWKKTKKGEGKGEKVA